jgi:hypothetical protein
MKILNCFIILIIGLCYSFLIFPNKILNSEPYKNISLDDKLDRELDCWRKLFKWYFIHFPNNPIFCKGGQVLALEILKDLLNNNSSNYDNFFTLDLINDWDLNIYMNDEQKNKLTNFVKTLDFEVMYFIINEGSQKNFNLIRYKNKIKREIDSKEFYLLELKVSLIKIEKQLDEYEMPFTCLGFEINSENLELFLEIMKISIKNYFNLKNEKYKINQLLSNLKIYGWNLFDFIENGLYIINNPKKIQTVYLSPQLIQIINNFIKLNTNNLINPLTIKQFLINQLSYARLFYRTKKNIIKCENIITLYEKNNINLPRWLMNREILKELSLIVNLFLNFLKEIIDSQLIIPERPILFDIKKSVKEFIDNIDILLKNIYLKNLINKKQDKITLIKIIPFRKFEILKKKYLQNQKEDNFDYKIFLPDYKKSNYLNLLKNILCNKI